MVYFCGGSGPWNSHHETLLLGQETLWSLESWSAWPGHDYRGTEPGCCSWNKSLTDRGRKWKEDKELNNRSYTWSQMERLNLCRRLMVLYSKLLGNFIWNFFTTVNIVCAISYFYFMWEKNSPSMAQHFTATITADFIDQRCVSMLALAVMLFFCETLWALQPLSHTDTHKTFKFSYLLFNLSPI